MSTVGFYTSILAMVLAGVGGGMVGYGGTEYVCESANEKSDKDNAAVPADKKRKTNTTGLAIIILIGLALFVIAFFILRARSKPDVATTKEKL